MRECAAQVARGVERSRPAARLATHEAANANCSLDDSRGDPELSASVRAMMPPIAARRTTRDTATPQSFREAYPTLSPHNVRPTNAARTTKRAPRRNDQPAKTSLDACCAKLPAGPPLTAGCRL